MNGTGSATAFGIPANLSPGYYLARLTTGTAFSAGYAWIAVDQAQKNQVALSDDQHLFATRIQPGQTVTGTLTGSTAHSPTGSSDYNSFYFIGTAGSRVSLSMERVDTSRTWEHPDSLDPELFVIAPDGFVYDNLYANDTRRVVDLNAALTSVELPATGIYIVTASTSKGSGDYKLTFNVDTQANVPPDSRTLMLTGSRTTVPLNAPVTAQAVMLDARGYPLSGAAVTFYAQPQPGDTGVLHFDNGNATMTSAEGVALKQVTLTAAGKASFSASLTDAALASSMAVREELGRIVPDIPREVTRYQPAFRARYAITELAEDGSIGLAGKGQQPLAQELMLPRHGVGDGSSKSPVKDRKAAAIAYEAIQPLAEGKRTPVPLRQRSPLVTPTSCNPLFVIAGVDVENLNAPYSVVLTDLTPSTGQAQPNGVVDINGIHGHRIEKTIRLKVEVKDKDGNAPLYPVVVWIGVGGPQAGTLILDPDAERIECKTASFLWDPVLDSRNEIEYKLGTLSRFVGVAPDSQNPTHLNPVWGVTELIEIAIYVTTETGGTDPLKIFDQGYDVHPEPGKPDHFVYYTYDDTPFTNVIPYWAGSWNYPAGLKQNGQPKTAAGHNILNVFYLTDHYNNLEYGYTATAATRPASNLKPTFADETSFGQAGYELTTEWNDDPEMPSGSSYSTLSVTYPADPDWGQGIVEQQIHYDFAGGTAHVLERFSRGYDATFGADDGTFPMSVSPGASTSTLPTTGRDVKRMVLLAVAGTHVWDAFRPEPEPFEAPHKVYVGNTFDHLQAGLDPHLEVQTSAHFRLSIVDGDHNVVPEASFKVHRCPRNDHEGPPNGVGARGCDVAALDSEAGVIADVELNPATGPDDGSNRRGYLGVELTTAPLAPGTYYIAVESLDGSYRVNRESDFAWDRSPAAEFKGAFAICTVGGVEFLDANLSRVDVMTVDASTPAYLRMSGVSTATSTLSLQLTSRRASGDPLSQNVPINLGRLGASKTFLGLLSLEPEHGLTPSRSQLVTEDAGLIVALGPGTLQAMTLTGDVVATQPSLFSAILRPRFIRRDAPDSCYSDPTDSCLTVGDTQLLPGTRQETAIVTRLFDKTWHGPFELCPASAQCSEQYQEAVGLMIDAVNPIDVANHVQDPQVLGDAGYELRFQEDPNPLYEEDLRHGTQQYFFNGVSGSTAIPRLGGTPKFGTERFDGQPHPVKLISGRTAIRLFATATVRRDLVGQVVPTTPMPASHPYTTGLSVSVKAPPIPIALPAVMPAATDIKLWVDERTYQRTRSTPQAAWTLGSNGTLDWLEARARNYIADPSGNQAPDADEVFRRAVDIRDGWDLPLERAAVSLTFEPGTIKLNPAQPVIRLGYWEIHDAGSDYHGFRISVPTRLLFAKTLSHEARHTWQLTLRDYGYEDADEDFLPSSPPPGSPELRDAPFPANPEHHFSGDVQKSTSSEFLNNEAAWSEAVEHNADRFASANVLNTALSCSPNYRGTAIATTYPNLIVATFLHDDLWINTAPVTGRPAILEKDTGDQSRPCSTSTGWQELAIANTNAGGVAAFPVTTFSGRYRIRLVNPPECTTEVSTCVTP